MNPINLESQTEEQVPKSIFSVRNIAIGAAGILGVGTGILLYNCTFGASTNSTDPATPVNNGNTNTNKLSEPAGTPVVIDTDPLNVDSLEATNKKLEAERVAEAAKKVAEEDERKKQEEQERRLSKAAEEEEIKRENERLAKIKAEEEAEEQKKRGAAKIKAAEEEEEKRKKLEEKASKLAEEAYIAAEKEAYEAIDAFEVALTSVEALEDIETLKEKRDVALLKAFEAACAKENDLELKNPSSFEKDVENLFNQLDGLKSDFDEKIREASESLSLLDPLPAQTSSDPKSTASSNLKNESTEKIIEAEETQIKLKEEEVARENAAKEVEAASEIKSVEEESKKEAPTSPTTITADPLPADAKIGDSAGADADGIKDVENINITENNLANSDDIASELGKEPINLIKKTVSEKDRIASRMEAIKKAIDIATGEADITVKSPFFKTAKAHKHSMNLAYKNKDKDSLKKLLGDALELAQTNYAAVCGIEDINALAEANNLKKIESSTKEAIGEAFKKAGALKTACKKAKSDISALKRALDIVSDPEKSIILVKEEKKPENRAVQKGDSVTEAVEDDATGNETAKVREEEEVEVAAASPQSTATAAEETVIEEADYSNTISDSINNQFPVLNWLGSKLNGWL